MFSEFEKNRIILHREKHVPKGMKRVSVVGKRLNGKCELFIESGFLNDNISDSNSIFSDNFGMFNIREEKSDIPS